MTESIYFVGDPGPGRVSMLNIIRQFGIEPKRIQINEPLPIINEGDEPLAIFIGPDIENRAGFITSLKERRDLASIPVLARVEHDSDEEVESAILDGVDDVLVDGSEMHFGAFMVHLGKTEDWNILRAPQGLAVLAENDRTVRIRLANVLRKNGYDVQFASTSIELATSIPVNRPRISIVSLDLAKEAIEILLESQTDSLDELIPWVVYAKSNNSGATDLELENFTPDAFAYALPVIQKVGILKDMNSAEQLTFVINEVVAPEKPEVRLTPRLLYGTTVKFGAIDTDLTLRGYMYNINSKGLFVRTLVPLPKGSKVNLEFKAPLGNDIIEVEGQVVWVKEFSNNNGPAAPPGMGIQMLEWKDNHQQIYERAYNALRVEQESDRVTKQSPDILSSFSKSSSQSISSEHILSSINDSKNDTDKNQTQI